MSEATTLDTADDVKAYFDHALAEAFRNESAANTHDPLTLSLSGLGGCTRHAAYSITRTPPTDTPPLEESRAAHLGTWQHNGLLPRLAEQCDGREEQPVVLKAGGLQIRGTLDLATTGVIADLKTVGERRLGWVRRNLVPYPLHHTQVAAYALAAFQAGLTVKWLVWIYLDRANGDHQVVVEQWSTELAMRVLDRVRHIRAFEADPDTAPREERGPGFSFACDRCPWLKRCWGPDAVPGARGPQRTLVYDDPTTVTMLQLYYDAQQAEAKHGRDKEFAKAALEGTRAGEYGPFKLGRGDDIESGWDHDAIRAVFEELGRPVPTKTRRGNFTVKVVKPVKPKPVKGARKGKTTKDPS